MASTALVEALEGGIRRCAPPPSGGQQIADRARITDCRQVGRSAGALGSRATPEAGKLCIRADLSGARSL
eukprot:5940220-Alexandrium_andersonii.AAC.1